MKSVMLGACSWLSTLVIAMDHVLISQAVSFDAPPDLQAMLGPPPKPSWVKYDLHCDKTGISSASTNGLAHDTSSSVNTVGYTSDFSLLTTSSTTQFSAFSPVTAAPPSPSLSPKKTNNGIDENEVNKGFSYNVLNRDGWKTLTQEDSTLDYNVSVAPPLSSTSKLALPAAQIGGIVAGLCVFILLILVVLYLLKKREKSLVPKYKVNPQKAAEESNYLYNYRVRGKTWGEEDSESTYTVGRPDPFLTRATEKETHNYLTKGSGGSNASLDTGYNEGAPQGVYTGEEGGYPNDSLPHGGSMSTSSGISLSHSDLNNMGDEQSDTHGHVPSGLSSIRPDLIESTMKAKPVIHRRKQLQPGSQPVLAPIQKQERSLEKPGDKPRDRPRRKLPQNPRYEQQFPMEPEQIAVASFPSPQRATRGPVPEPPVRPARTRGSLTSVPATRNSGPRKHRSRKMPPGYPERSTVEDSV